MRPSSPQSEFQPMRAEVLYALLIKLIHDRGGSVIVRVPDLLEQVTNITWSLTARPGPGPNEGTWSIEQLSPRTPGTKRDA